MTGLEHWHGTANGYNNHRCRCKDCREAHRKISYSRDRTRKAERIELDGVLIHPRAPHGTPNAYRNYGCRCSTCTKSWAKDIRERRRAARIRAMGETK